MKAPLDDSLENLPPPNTTRWVIRHKAAVVVAVRSGRMTIEEVCHAYQLSEEEFLSWERLSRPMAFLVCARPAFSIIAGVLEKAGRNGDPD